MDYDAVIIGAGIGGLTGGAFLAKNGLKVLLLEQSLIDGGYCHSFTRKRFEFDAAIRYIGACGPGQDVNLILKGLGLDGQIEFLEINPDGYDKLIFPDFTVDVPKGAAAYRERLKQLFPKEAEGIDSYFNVVEAMWTEIRKPAPDWSSPLLASWGDKTLKDLLTTSIKDPKLAAVLAGQNFNYALPPSQVSLIAHSRVIMHYLQGAYFPKGGCQTIPNGLLKVIKANEGEIRTRTRVKRIVIENNKAVGVVLQKGDEEIRAKLVISNADAKETFLELVGTQNLSPDFSRRIVELKPSLSSIILYLGVEMDLAALGLTPCNYWLHYGYDMEGPYESLGRGQMPVDPSIFLSVPSLKDPGSVFAPEGMHTLKICALAPYEPFKPWRELPFMRRGEEYMKLKSEIADRLIAKAEKVIPGLKEHIVLDVSGSPLTNEYYTLSAQGAIYGPAKTPDQVGRNSLPIKTEIENLYLTGANTSTHGVAGCMLSGLATASAIFGGNLYERVMADSG